MPEAFTVTEQQRDSTAFYIIYNEELFQQQLYLKNKLLNMCVNEKRQFFQI